MQQCRWYFERAWATCGDIHILLESEEKLSVTKAYVELKKFWKKKKNAKMEFFWIVLVHNGQTIGRVYTTWNFQWITACRDIKLKINSTAWSVRAFPSAVLFQRSKISSSEEVNMIEQKAPHESYFSRLGIIHVDKFRKVSCHGTMGILPPSAFV